MPQIGGQQWELGRKINSCPIPRQQTADRERMTEVVNPRPGLSFRPPKAKRADDFKKDRGEGRLAKPFSPAINEERRVGRQGHAGFAALTQIGLKLRNRRGR